MLFNGHLARQYGSILCRSALVLLISAFAGAALTRFSPGFGIDEQTLDARLSSETIRNLNHELGRDENFASYFVRFLSGLLHGDLGRSTSFSQPVSEIVRERLPVTFRNTTAGLAAGWLAAVALASFAALTRSPVAKLAAVTMGGSLLCVPSALVAVLCVVLRLPPAAAIAAVVFPRVFGYAQAELRSGLAEPHVLMARARGVGPVRVFVCHVVPTVLLPLLALAGVSVTLALSAAIPVEALTDSPGVGQLAWRAAMSRDMPVLVAITLLLTAVTVAANLGTDLVSDRIRAESV